MKAIVKYGTGDRNVELREVSDPVEASDSVVIAVRAVGVCGSDIHAWRNQQSWDMALPVVLGHEAAGVVSSVGDRVTGWSVGDRVVCETAASICGRCALCRSGRYNLCPHREGYGALRDGSMAEYVLAESRTLHRIPDDLQYDVAAMTEPSAVAFNALVERASISPGDVVVVQGVGAIGALAIQIARLRGASAVIALGTGADGARLDLAAAIGATKVVDVSRQDPAEVVSAEGDGLGADLVVDATGVSAALNQALEVVRPYGSIVKIGWGPQPLDFSLDPLVAKAVTMYGSFSHTWNTWERVLRLAAKGELDPGAIIGGRYTIEEFADGFEAMDSKRVIKSVIVMKP